MAKKENENEIKEVVAERGIQARNITTEMCLEIITHMVMPQCMKLW